MGWRSSNKTFSWEEKVYQKNLFAYYSDIKILYDLGRPIENNFCRYFNSRFWYQLQKSHNRMCPSLFFIYLPSELSNLTINQEPLIFQFVEFIWRFYNDIHRCPYTKKFTINPRSKFSSMLNPFFQYTNIVIAFSRLSTNSFVSSHNALSSSMLSPLFTSDHRAASSRLESFLYYLS